MSSYKNILVSIDAHVGTITLNRPEKLNAFTVEMVDEGIEAFRMLTSSEEVRVVVVTGAGPAFCAGADVEELKRLVETGDEATGRRIVEASREVGRLIRRAPQPVIACVNGVAAGGGANLALACDLRVASDHAQIGQVFMKIGLHPDWGGTYYLPRLVGTAKAFELFLSAELLDAAHAERLGIFNKVVEAHHLADYMRSFARHIAAAPPLAVRLAKQAVYLSERSTLDEMLDYELQAQLTCFRSEDAKEGLEAFLAKRTPHFTGR